MGLFRWFRRRQHSRDKVAETQLLSPAAEHGFAVVDVETTGFSHLKNRIVEIAVVRTDSRGNIVDEWSTLLNPDGPVGATHVHGIKAADVRNAPRFAEITGDLAARLSGRAVVAHNASFDLAFIRTEFARAGVAMPGVPFLCTLEASELYLPDLSRRRLADCCWAGGVEHEGAHTALGDAIATARLLRSYLGHPRPDPTHVEMPAHAARVLWPPFVRRPVALVQRHVSPLALIPAPPGRLASLLEDLPISAAVQEWAPSTTAAYVELLAEVLEDGILTSNEAGSLIDLAAVYSLSRDQVYAAHRGFLLAVAHKAIEDGTVTDAERRELHALSDILGFKDSIVGSLLDEAAAAFVASHVMERLPLPAGWLHGDPLCVGIAVAFTGCEEAERARLEARARAAGLRVTGSVSRRTSVLVTDGANPGTRKAVAARALGTRTVTPAEFALLVSHVQPAPEGLPSVLALTPDPHVSVMDSIEAAVLATVVDLGAVRAWARANGLTVGVRGRIARDVLVQYRAAHAVA